MANTIDSLLQGQPIQRRDRQRGKSDHTVAQRAIGLVKGETLFRVGPLNLYRISQSPMRADRLAGPRGAVFIGRPVADGKDEIKNRTTGPLKLRYILGSQDRHIMPPLFQNLTCKRIQFRARSGACRVDNETITGEVAQDRFCKDGARGIARAYEQYTKIFDQSLVWLQPGRNRHWGRKSQASPCSSHSGGNQRSRAWHPCRWHSAVTFQHALG